MVLLPAACVGSAVTVLCGDAPASPPWLRPKSPAARDFRIRYYAGRAVAARAVSWGMKPHGSMVSGWGGLVFAQTILARCLGENEVLQRASKSALTALRETVLTAREAVQAGSIVTGFIGGFVNPPARRDSEHVSVLSIDTSNPDRGNNKASDLQGSAVEAAVASRSRGRQGLGARGPGHQTVGRRR